MKNKIEKHDMETVPQAVNCVGLNKDENGGSDAQIGFALTHALKVLRDLPFCR